MWIAIILNLKITQSLVSSYLLFYGYMLLGSSSLNLILSFHYPNRLNSSGLNRMVLLTDITPLYTISNRGSLQLILNRYMYLCHHHSYGGRKRRWRCIDYRRMQCPAIVDTMDENVTNRYKFY